jgi:biopolymer transport protein ExbB
MSNDQKAPKAASKKTSGGFSSLISTIVIAIALVIGFMVYKYVFGNPGNFVENNPEAEPKEGNILGIIYKGGIIVPFLLAVNITVLIFAIERFVTLAKSKGKGNIDTFISKIKVQLTNKQFTEAIAECDKQRGSLANVVRAGLEKYSHIANDTELNKEQKVESLKKELEEATALELPMMSKNLSVISTCASIGTLIGLIGTVLGMIRSFAAMSQGAPDTGALATGISEALINTAFGIFASTLAIIFYNFFSTKIDSMTYSIDEASFTIVQDFTSSNK